MSKPAFAIIASSLLIGVVTAGCNQFMQKPRCEPLGDCGGEFPAGTWILDPTHVSCSEDIYIPPSDPRVLMGTVPVSRQPPPEPTLSDWCDSIVVTGGTTTVTHEPEFYYYDGHIGVASVHYQPTDAQHPENGGTFSAGLTQVGNFKLDFPAYCMRAFAGRDGRQADPANDPTGPSVSLCKQVEAAVRSAGTGAGAYPNAACEDSKIEAGGCTCTFDVTATSGPAGAYQVLKGNTNTIYNLLNNNFPQKVTYCRRGDDLELTGTDGAYLFDKTGLRTMRMKKTADVMPPLMPPPMMMTP
jgi:hypothetical protein